LYYRLCRYFILCGGCRNRWIKLANAVPYDFDTLYPPAINALCLVNIDFFNELSDNLRCEFLYVVFPDFRMRLKLDKKTGKVMYGADIQSVFDICWYTFSRMVADVAPPADEDLNYFESQGSILSCLACGKYFVRHSSRQLYCNNWDCQAERNRRNRRASYARKKAEEAKNKK
jgi:hypothetical protein